MGSCASTVIEARILMCGLDSSGKTTVLYRTKLGDCIDATPTVGFNVEYVNVVRGISFTVWDVGGQDRIRPLWRHYFQAKQGLLYVVDCSDEARMDEAKTELFRVLDNDDTKGLPLVIIANKQDVPGAMTVEEIAQCLDLSEIIGREWFIEGACATTGVGITESFEKMAALIMKDRQRNKS